MALRRCIVRWCQQQQQNLAAAMAASAASAAPAAAPRRTGVQFAAAQQQHQQQASSSSATPGASATPARATTVPLATESARAAADVVSKTSAQEATDNATSSSSSSRGEVLAATTQSHHLNAAASWMPGAAWASMGPEFKGLDESKLLQILPTGFLSPRATTDIQPDEATLAKYVATLEQTYKGLDVRDPSTVAAFDGEKPGWITVGDQVRAVAEFISGHLAHHCALPAWQALFDLKHVEMDLMYWLWVIHLHIVARRSTSVPIATWSRRREVLDELFIGMKLSWVHTSEDIMGRPPLSRIRNYIRDMYLVTAANLEEALMHDGPGGDLALMGVLMKFCPLPRPEDVPMYTYYTLVHYVRFHVALFDRVPDEMIARGNFNFMAPDDPAIFARYTDVDLDRTIRGWTVDDSEGGGAAATSSSSQQPQPGASSPPKSSSSPAE